MLRSPPTHLSPHAHRCGPLVPDGQQIAFSGSFPGKPWQVFLVSKDGGSPQSLTSANAQETDPSWSQDGNTLAIGHHDVVHPDETFIELVDVRTRQISQVPDSKGISAPRWSPDGRYILAITARQRQAHALRREEPEVARTQDRLDSLGYLTWSPDSASVYFNTVLNGDAGYFRLRISDAKMEKVVDLKKIRLYRDQFGPSSWTGLRAGEIPLFPRDISTQEIYAFDLQLP